jgi:cell division protein FtsL
MNTGEKILLAVIIAMMALTLAVSYHMSDQQRAVRTADMELIHELKSTLEQQEMEIEGLYERNLELHKRNMQLMQEYDFMDRFLRLLEDDEEKVEGLK